MALTILFKFNAMADKRHSFVTAGMPRFLTLERQYSRFSTGNNPSAHILCRRIHVPVGIAANMFVPSIESRIAAASKNSAPNACLFKIDRV